MIERGEFDEILFRGLRAYSASMQDAVRAHGDPVASQVLAAYFQARPVLEDSRGDHARVDALLRQLMDSPGFQEARKGTRLHSLSSAVATCTLLDALPPMPQPPGQGNGGEGQEGQEGQEGGQGGQGEGEGQEGQEGGQGQGQGQGEGQESGQGQGQEEGQPSQGGQGGRAQPHHSQGDVDNAAAQAAHAAQAAEELANMENPTRGGGFCYGSGQGESVRATAASADKVKEFAGAVAGDPGFRRVVSLLGAMRKIAGEIRKTKSGGTGHVSGVARGDQLASVLPQEIALLANRQTRKDVLRRFTEKNLAQYQQAGRDRSGRGALCVLVDRSGSMDGSCWQTAKALTLSLALVAAEESRDLGICLFNVKAQPLGVFPGGRVPLEKSTQFLDAGSCGGTSFDPPLRWAADVVRKARGHRRPDIVLICDGLSDLNLDTLRELHELRQRYGTRILGILVTTRDQGETLRLGPGADGLPVVLNRELAMYKGTPWTPDMKDSAFQRTSAFFKICDRAFHLPMEAVRGDLHKALPLFRELFTL